MPSSSSPILLSRVICTGADRVCGPSGTVQFGRSIATTSPVLKSLVAMVPRKPSSLTRPTSRPACRYHWRHSSGFQDGIPSEHLTQTRRPRSLTSPPFSLSHDMSPCCSTEALCCALAARAPVEQRRVITQAAMPPGQVPNKPGQ